MKFIAQEKRTILKTVEGENLNELLLKLNNLLINKNIHPSPHVRISVVNCMIKLNACSLIIFQNMIKISFFVIFYVVFFISSLPLTNSQSFSLLNGTGNSNKIMMETQSDNLTGMRQSTVLIGTAQADNLKGTTSDDFIFGGAGFDNITGGAGNDEIDGGDGGDNLSGGDGDDVIFGGIGNDNILGDDGNDDIYGGPGADNLTGGKGADYFDFGTGKDRVLDFNISEGDLKNVNCES